MSLDLTRRQRAVLEAYVRHGTYRDAADELGITEGAARSRIGWLCKKNGWKGIAQAAYHLGMDEVSTKTQRLIDTEPLSLAM